MVNNGKFQTKSERLYQAMLSCEAILSPVDVVLGEHVNVVEV